MSKQRSFGKAKPIVGQHGYGKTVSQKLEEDAAKMEARLNELRLLNNENKARFAAADAQRDDGGKGGGRWRSSRLDRGSLGKYSADVRAGRGSKEGGGRRDRSTSICMNSCTRCARVRFALLVSMHLTPSIVSHTPHFAAAVRLCSKSPRVPAPPRVQENAREEMIIN